MGGFEAVLLMACFIAAVWDFLYWEIPNEVTLFIIALFVIKVLLVGDFSNILTPLLFAFVFIIAKDRGILEARGRQNGASFRMLSFAT